MFTKKASNDELVLMMLTDVVPKYIKLIIVHSPKPHQLLNHNVKQHKIIQTNFMYKY